MSLTAEDRARYGPDVDPSMTGIERGDRFAELTLNLVFDVRDDALSAFGDADALLRDAQAAVSDILDENDPAYLVEQAIQEVDRLRQEILDELQAIVDLLEKAVADADAAAAEAQRMLVEKAWELRDFVLDLQSQLSDLLDGLIVQLGTLVDDYSDKVKDFLAYLQGRIKDYQDQLGGIMQYTAAAAALYAESMAAAIAPAIVVRGIDDLLNATKAPSQSTDTAMQVSPPSGSDGSAIALVDEFWENDFVADHWNLGSFRGEAESVDGYAVLTVEEVNLPMTSISTQAIKMREDHDAILLDTSFMTHVAGLGSRSILGVRIHDPENPGRSVDFAFDAFHNKAMLHSTSGESGAAILDPYPAARKQLQLLVGPDEAIAAVGGTLLRVDGADLSKSESVVVTLFAQTRGTTAGWTQSLAIDYLTIQSQSSSTNIPPNAPGRPSGAGSTVVGREEGYVTTATDADQDALTYYFDWGDGPSTWSSPAQPHGSAHYAWHTWQAPNDPYSVRVKAKDVNGGESLWSDPKDVYVNQPMSGDEYEPDDTVEEASSIALDDSNHYQFRSLRPDGDYDYVQFNGVVGTTYTFSSEGATDTTGAIYDQGQQLRAWDDDAGSGLNFRITFQPPVSGTYYLLVTGRAYETTGDYTLVGSTDGASNVPPAPSCIQCPTTIVANRAVTFQWVAGDPNGDEIRFMVDWGDGTDAFASGWMPHMASLGVGHLWEALGVYTVTVLVQDDTGALGPALEIHVSVVPLTCSAMIHGGQACQVLMLHGFAGTDAHADHVSMSGFADLDDDLTASGYHDVRRVGYYGDTCGVEGDAGHVDSESPRFTLHDEKVYLPGGTPSDAKKADHRSTEGCNSVLPTDNRHDEQTTIRHLAQHVAWYIYDEYSQNDEPIDVVAHSMGGLLIRYIFVAMLSDLPAYPPRVDIEDVVTLGSPHGGGNWACLAPSGVNTQVSEMCHDSWFMRDLRDRGMNPQLTGSGQATEWTTIGSSEDEWVDAKSSMEMRPDYWMVYESPAYKHSDYYAASKQSGDVSYIWGERSWDDTRSFREDEGNAWFEIRQSLLMKHR
jgi:hypothetical protein